MSEPFFSGGAWGEKRHECFLSGLLGFLDSGAQCLVVFHNERFVLIESFFDLHK